MTYRQFQFLILLWKTGVVNTFGLIKICANCGAQYLGVVLSSAAGNFSDIGPRVLLEPITGLGVSAQFVVKGATILEKRQRIATLAAFISASAAAVSTDPTTNAAMGGVIASKISYMKAILARGGETQVGSQATHFLGHQLKRAIDLTDYKFKIVLDQQQATKILLKQSLYRNEFTLKSKHIINNIFAEHTLCRCGKLSHFNYAELSKPLPSIFFISQLPRTPLNVSDIILWSSCAVGSICVLTIGSLYGFQFSKRKRWMREINNANEIIIDVPSVNLTNESVKSPRVKFIPVK